MRCICFLVLLLASATLARHSSEGEWRRGLLGIMHHRDDEITIDARERPDPSSFSFRSNANVKLSTSISQFRDGTDVTVSWSFQSDPKGVNARDWIGVYAPKHGDGMNQYVEYVWVTKSPSWQSGSGNVTFTLLNIRSHYVFRYFATLADQSWSLAGSSDEVAPSNPDEPLGAHIAYGNDFAQMRVMWVSASSRPSFVQFGRAPGRLDRAVSSQWKTYSADMLCGAPANRTGIPHFVDPGFMHEVLIKDLHPSTQYYYRVGNDVGGWSSVFRFVSASVPGDSQLVRIAAFGDMGESEPGSKHTVERLIEKINDITYVAHIGDLSYAMGESLYWDKFGYLLQNLASRVPYMINIGNHEYDHLYGAENDPSGVGLGFHPSWGNFEDDSRGECGVPVVHRWTMPENGKGVFWFSFEIGSVHLIMMSTEHDFTKGSEQYQWLEKDLQSVNRVRTPWVVLGGHRPMYCSEKYMDDYNVTLGMQAAFEDLIYENKVDLAIWGHYHSYERTCPVYKQACAKEGKAPVHVVIGMAGAGLDNAQYFDVPWSVFHDQKFGHSMISANHTHLVFEYIHNRDLQVADSFTLTR